MNIKKNILIFGFVIISLFVSVFFVSSVSIELNPQYSKGETLIAKVSGNFIDNIQKEDISFYRRHMPTSIAEYNVVEIEGDFYIYAKIEQNKPEDNYSLRIENVRYMNDSYVSDEPIIGNFSVGSETSDFWVYPGVKIVEEDYSLTVQNLKPYEITVNVNPYETYVNNTCENETNGTNETCEEEVFIESEETITLLSGEIREIEFQLETQTYVKEIDLSSENTEYSIKIYNIYSGPPINQTNETNLNNTNSSNQEINNTNSTEGNTTYINETEEGNVTIVINGSEEEISKEQAKSRKCSDIDNGNVCLDNETCEGETFYASDALCCLGECKTDKKSNVGKTIGWILLIIVLGVGGFVFYKNKKKKGKEPDLIKVGGGRK